MFRAQDVSSSPLSEASARAADDASSRPKVVMLSDKLVNAARAFQDRIYHVHDEEALSSLLAGLRALPFAREAEAARLEKEKEAEAAQAKALAMEKKKVASSPLASSSGESTPARSSGSTLKRKSTDTVATTTTTSRSSSSDPEVRDVWREAVSKVDTKEISDFSLPLEVTDPDAARMAQETEKQAEKDKNLRPGTIVKTGRKREKKEKRDGGEKREKKERPKKVKMTESGEPVAKRGRGRPPLPETIRPGKAEVTVGSAERGRDKKVEKREGLPVPNKKYLSFDDYLRIRREKKAKREAREKSRITAVSEVAVKRKRGRPFLPATLRKREAAAAAAAAALAAAQLAQSKDDNKEKGEETPETPKDGKGSPTEYSKPNRSIFPRRRFSPGARNVFKKSVSSFRWLFRYSGLSEHEVSAGGARITIKHSDVCCLPGPIAGRLAVVCSLALAGTVAYLYYTRATAATPTPPPRNLRFEPEPANNLDTARCLSPLAATPTKRKRESSI
ncbi:hypothetical protein PRIPAC_85658 [Pristionchus pacificus]|uniref:Uncharacterized protein n=1 Tax=Pristionchus pacificus TaxID=54126 RepID=A0A2A6BN87_PRIPA|nr:hypothetical protein PRIPAC_85658 [Pristionchus pacificus]|eukprot:PDM67263.1 hypothetical protein PRIPAC_48680 [Pristionchus pacificus]